MIKTMLNRLFSHLHRAVFDTTADELIAFKLDGPAGCSWVAANENFDITFADGRTVHFDLNDFQIWELISALQFAGMTVTSIHPDALYFSGITMLELSGEAGNPNPVILYKDILHAIFGAYSREMRIASDQVGQALNQMEIPKADDGFLNQWGTQFGIERGDRTDDVYRKFIPLEAFRVRINTLAIIATVKDLTGYTIDLEEPWREVFRLDNSALSGSNQFYNNSEVAYFLVRPVSFGTVDWAKIFPIIDRNLAAGVKRIKEDFRGQYGVNDPLSGNLWEQSWELFSSFVRGSSMPRLDNEIRLDGGLASDPNTAGYEFEYNYSVIQTSFWATQAQAPINGTTGDSWRSSLIFFAPRADEPVGISYESDFAGAFLEMYPSTPRTWMGGKWDHDSTWKSAYQWNVGVLYTSTENQFLVDGTSLFDGMDPGVMEMTMGETWTSEATWNNDTWDQGSQ